MKKLFTLVVLSLLVIGGISAQSLTIHDPATGSNVPSGSVLTLNNVDATITFPGGPPAKYSLYVVNTNPNTALTNVRRYKINSPQSVTELFCYGPLCNGPDVEYNASCQASINSMDTNKTFYSDVYPNNYYGVITLRYVFFLENNPSDSVYVDIQFATAGADVEKPFIKSTITAPYPNPAKDITVFEYSLNSASEGKVVIYDMAGNAVKEKEITDASGKLKMNVEDLNNGVYFYTFYANDKAISTKRLIVSK